MNTKQQLKHYRKLLKGYITVADGEGFIANTQYLEALQHVLSKIAELESVKSNRPSHTAVIL